MNKIKIASVMLWIVLLAVIPVQATGNLATDIEQQLRASYLNDGSEYVVTIPNFVTTLPSEYDSIRVEPLGESALVGTCWIRVFFFKGNSIFQNATVNLQISLYQQVMIAKAAIKKGEPLASGLFESGRREVTSQSDKPVAANELEGMSAARPISQGKILTQSMMTREEIVKSGDLVTIEYQNGNLKVTAAGEARQAGYRGGIIKVRNINSNKIVSAEVQDERSVRVLR